MSSLSLVASMLTGVQLAQVVTAPLAAAAADLSVGSVTTLAGSGANVTAAGSSTTASFGTPQALAYYGGSLYVADSDAIAQVATATGATTVLTTGVGGAEAIATDGSNVYTATFDSSTISTTVIATGATTTLPALPASVQSLTLSSGLLYVTAGNVVYQQDPSSGAISTVATFPSTEAVEGIAADGVGELFVLGTDSSTGVTRIATVVISSGAISTLTTDSSLRGGFFSQLFYMAGYLYAGASDDFLLRRYSATTGAGSITAGSGSSGHADGTGAKAWFNSVNGLTGDGTNLFVADSSNGTGNYVRKVAPGVALTDVEPASVASAVAVDLGTSNTLAGNGNQGSASGTGGPNGTASFNEPEGITYLNGSLYVADADAISKVNPATGATTVVAGGSGTVGCAGGLVGTAVGIPATLALTTDGTFVYALVNTCGDEGVLRFDPVTTSVSYLPTMADGAWQDVTVGPDKALYATIGPYIDRMSLVDGSTTRFATLPTSGSLSGIAADGTYLYVLGDPEVSGNGEQIYKVNVATGAYTVGAPNPLFEHGQITLAGSRLYLRGQNENILSVNQTTGATSNVAGGVAGYADGTGPGAEFFAIQAMVSDGSSLFVTDETQRVRLVRGVPPTLPEDSTFGGCSRNNSLGLHTQCNTNRGDPVDTATGAFSKAMTDVAFPGVGETLKFQRTYTSADTTAGRLGIGWTDPYQASLSVDGTGNVTFRSENGAQGIWTHNSDGSYTPPLGAYSALTAVSGGGWKLTTPDQHTLTFNFAGQLTKMTDAHNKGLTFGYTGTVQTSITDAAGRKVTLGYTAGLLTSLSLPDGRKVSYGYTNNRLTSVTPLGGHGYTFSYDSNGLLASETDALGQVMFTNAYDPTSGRLVKQVDGNGNATSYGWDSDTQTATVTDPDGGVWSDVYSGNTLLRTRDPAGGYTYYSYDGSRNLVATQDPLGHVTRMFYDAAGNMVTSSRLGASGGAQTTTWTYNSLGEPLTAVDPMTYKTKFTYNAVGDRTSTVDPTGAKTTWTWNSDGTMATMVDPRGNVTGCACASTYTTTYGYDPAGNQTSMTTPLGEKTTYGYDADGRLTSTVDPRGNVAGGTPATYTTTRSYNGDDQLHTLTDANTNTTTDNYDTAGRLSGVTNAANRTTSFGYDLDGNTTTATNALAHSSTTTYDWAGHATKVVDADGNITTHTYDTLGRLATSTDPRGNVTGAKASNYTTTYGYDADSELTSVTRPISSTVTAKTLTTYDAFNRITKITDPNGHSTSTSYDYDGRATSTTDGNGKITYYTYDQDGRVLSVKDPNGHITYYTYDPDGRLLTRQDADGRTTTNTYDADGQLKTTLSPDSPALTTSYGYDPAGHETSISYSDGTTPNVTFGYDPAGRPTTMTDGTGTTTTAYDTRNRVTAVTNGANAVVGYGYNDADQLTSMTYPGARTVTYGLTNAGMPHTITDWNGHTTTIGLDQADELTSLAYPNGVTAAYTNDQAGRLTAITDKTSTATLASYAYKYDTGSRMTSDMAAITGQPADNRAYTYTNADQLKTDSTGSYGQDPANEVTSTPAGNGTDTAEGYDPAGQLNSSTAAGVVSSYTFNARGDRTAVTPATGTSTALTYDQADEMTGWVNGATAVNYTYNGVGEVMTRSSGGLSTGNVWDSQTATPALLDDGTNSYLYGPAGPLEQVNDSTGATTYLLQDHLGSTKLVTDPTGVVVGSYRYDAYGNPTFTGSVTTPLQYAGEDTDPLTGLQDLAARWYDPASGQFLTLDPLVDATGTPYAYAANNPVTNTDPTGLFTGEGNAKFLMGEAVGVAKAAAGMVGAAVKASVDPVATIEGLIKACKDGVDQYYGDNVAGGLKCLDNLNPAAAIRNAFENCWHIAEQNHDYQAGQQCGTAFTEAAAILAGGADGAAATAGDLDPAEVPSDETLSNSADNSGDTATSCMANSFTADTQVAMADGTTKPLDQVKVGDKVEATDPATGKTSAQTVSRVWVNHDTDLMNVTVTSGGETSVINSTQHHPFWDTTRHAWTPAAQLQAGDQLRTDDGAVAVVASTAVVAGAAYMWDLTVQTTHDFYVVTTSANVLVHNCGGDAAEGGAGDLGLSTEESWGNPGSLARHFRDHGADFGATSADDYARQASSFLQRGLQEGLPTKIDANGVIRIYDPSTNTFGAYNPDGTTATFFKPTSPTYWDRQPGTAP